MYNDEKNIEEITLINGNVMIAEKEKKLSSEILQNNCENS
jgi:hypothetical protein